ncbi:hypothetical protein [Bifidobacterium scaligerum]|uniref:HK97 gp10 family phage protein n=1 Tax=Bifidobacterium scaligerum TaxID=2052656 RepID=A0A2M9HT99_9BIFI|nr:hypothetical protein [Bifidobacterium scaligerum]PJM80008.1 hypothetical protein CUU80_02415 [Bifidobacterium scaligerum]
MPDGIRFDVSDVLREAADLKAARIRAMPLLKATLSKASLNIKNTINDDLGKSRDGGFRKIRVSYDITTTPTGLQSEIGPRKGGSNDLANIAFFGTARGGGTHPFYEWMDPEAERLEQYATQAAWKAVMG